MNGTKREISIVRFLFVPLVVAIAMGASWGILAKEGDEKEGKERKTRRVEPINERMHQKLGEAQELINKSLEAEELLRKAAEAAEAAKNNDKGETSSDSGSETLDPVDPAAPAEYSAQARKILNKLLKIRGNSPLAKASAHRMLGYLAYAEEDYKQAVYHYEQMLVEPESIQEALEQEATYSLAQVYYLQENYERTLEYLLRWFDIVPEQGPDRYVFLAQVYYQNGDYDNAISTVRKAIGIAEEKNFPVKENWWLLLNAMYFQREEYEENLKVLYILLRDFPKPQYWIQLSGVYGQLEKTAEQRQSIDVAYIGDMLSRESRLLNVAGLLMQDEVYYRAAVIMEKGLKDGLIDEENIAALELLAQAWMAAQEPRKAIEVLEEIAAQSEDGNLYARLAQALFDEEKYEKCSDASLKAVEKGGLKNEDNAIEIHGMCAYSDDDFDSARTLFGELEKRAIAAESESDRVRAANWVKYVDSEEKRKKEIDRLWESLLVRGK